MSKEIIAALNPEQRVAATHRDGPMLILAGAGTGKTRVITARVAWLLSQGVSPDNILAVTFTNKAAREMQERIAKTSGKEMAKKLTVSTFHSLCVRILRRDAVHLGYKNNFSIYDESDQMGLIKKIIARTAARDEKLDPGLAKNLISKAKNSSWHAPEDEETLLGAVYLRYERELHALNSMDFDDLLLNGVKLLREHKQVRDYWQARYEFLLVDEFQDTNRLQLELVAVLAGARRNVCVVGDDDQSIYGWRGAEVSNILEFEQHFPDPRIVKLEQNYRSTSAILETANRLIRHNAQRRGKQLWSGVQGGQTIRVVCAPSDREEAEFIAIEISELKAMKQLKWEDFAVLFRMNTQSRVLEENLRRLQIPYRLVGGKSFFDRREVKDVMAYASAVLNPEDDVSLLRIINSPPRGIGETTLSLALEQSVKEERSLFATLNSEEFLSCCARKSANAVRTFASELAEIRETIDDSDAGHAEVFRKFIEESGYLDNLRRSCRTSDEAEGRLENVRDLLRDFEAYEARSVEGLRGFVDELSLNRDKSEQEDERPGVTLITLHAAKGLEFPHVYLVGVEDGVLPHERSKEEGTIDEERRLLYVGITRAMQHLTLTHCATRMRFGSPMACRPSPFLKEIEGEFVEDADYHEIANAPAAEETVTMQFDMLRDMLGRNDDG